MELFPLGVLKQAAVKFDPPLPSSKQNAIDCLAMGVLNKVYLRFSNVFWDEKIEGFGYIGEQPGRWSDWLCQVLRRQKRLHKKVTLKT